MGEGYSRGCNEEKKKKKKGKVLGVTERAKTEQTEQGAVEKRGTVRLLIEPDRVTTVHLQNEMETSAMFPSSRNGASIQRAVRVTFHSKNSQYLFKY